MPAFRWLRWVVALLPAGLGLSTAVWLAMAFAADHDLSERGVHVTATVTQVFPDEQYVFTYSAQGHDIRMLAHQSAAYRVGDPVRIVVTSTHLETAEDYGRRWWRYAGAGAGVVLFAVASWALIRWIAVPPPVAHRPTHRAR